MPRCAASRSGWSPSRSILQSGRLTPLHSAPLEASMAYMAIDRTGKWLLAASYPAGKVTVNPIGADGKVGVPACQILTDRPKAHCIRLDARKRARLLRRARTGSDPADEIRCGFRPAQPEYAGRDRDPEGRRPAPPRLSPERAVSLSGHRDDCHDRRLRDRPEKRHAEGTAIPRHARRGRRRSSPPRPICT